MVDSIRPMILDGITIQLAGELIFGIGSDFNDRHNARVLYREAIEEFAYAMLFADSLGRVGSLAERNGFHPAQQLVEYDRKNGQLFRHVLPAAPGAADTILTHPVGRKLLERDLGLLGESDFCCWEAYVQLEADTYLPARPTPSESPRPGANYSFPKRHEVYFDDVDLQRLVPRALVVPLAKSLSARLAGRPTDDLEEFVERVITTHYGISCWYDSGAAAVGYVRFPFVTRSVVRHRAAQRAKESQSNDDGRMRVTSFWAISNVLAEVLGGFRHTQRVDLYHQMLDARRDYKEHRECLNAIDYYSQSINYNRLELDAARSNLDRLLSGRPTRPAALTEEWEKTHYILAELNRLSYPRSLYDTFPELNPISEGRGTLGSPRLFGKPDDQPNKSTAYDCAISYASEDAPVARKIASALRDANVRVFFDDFERIDLIGRNLADHLPDVYGKAQFVIPIISAAYASKPWTSVEFASFLRSAEGPERLKQAYLLPVRLDDTTVPEVPWTVKVFDLRNVPIDQVVSDLIEKLRLSIERPSPDAA